MYRKCRITNVKNKGKGDIYTIINSHLSKSFSNFDSIS